MFINSGLLLMVEIMLECAMCGGKAIITDEKGNSRCSKCTTKFK
jgi:hypothetical protein